jgi:hypothetical protein
MAASFDWHSNIQQTVKTCRYINSGQSNFEFEYLGRFKTKFEKDSGYKSEAQKCSTDGGGRTSHATIRLTHGKHAKNLGPRVYK